ncbi:MAG: DUF262 domain-containing protein [Ktedonobacterales bacterium]|nr:DUF262 domain-containing protein [Ktedonobacterales bacterium]
MGISTHNSPIDLLVQDVKDRHLQLPELQRKYVWKSTQVRDFFDSLYHQYPTGQLLVWETDDLPYNRDVSATGIGPNHRRPQLLLDGQQRLTSLYAVMTGSACKVRDRTKRIEIVFNVFSQRFEVATAVTRPQSGWVSITQVFTKGVLPSFNELGLDLTSPEAQQALENLTRLDAIKKYTYHINVLSGLTYEEVTGIFVRINSGGTRLSNADLALAQVSSRWHGVTEELEEFQAQVHKLGWELDDSILLRVLSAIATNQATLSQFFKAGRNQELTEERLREAWQRAKPAMLQAIHFIKQNCLIDWLSMLPTNYVLVPLAVFFERQHQVTQQQERDLQRWLYMALIWARYSASSEANLDQDIKTLSEEHPVGHMIQNIADRVGPGRRVTERELQDQLSNSPFMVMAYVLARRGEAKDWFHAVGIGAGQDLEYHHIFPKPLLSPRYPDRAQSRIINQVANLAFLSQRANARIAASQPSDYLPSVEYAWLQAQYVPTNPALWTIDRYEDFVQERRKLLAEGINDLLASLMNEPAPWINDWAKQLEARLMAAEAGLRDLIALRLADNGGAHAWNRYVPSDIQQAVRQRIDQRIKRNPFESDQYDTLADRLAQCNFGDYAKIITSNWLIFGNVFSDKMTFERQMTSIQDARNAMAHHRAMNEGEQHTAAGGLYWIEQCLMLAARAEDDTEDEGEDEAENKVLVRVDTRAL